MKSILIAMTIICAGLFCVRCAEITQSLSISNENTAQNDQKIYSKMPKLQELSLTDLYGLFQMTTRSKRAKTEEFLFYNSQIRKEIIRKEELITKVNVKTQCENKNNIFYGKTDKWFNYDDINYPGVYVDVDYSDRKLKEPPFIGTFLQAKGNHWATTGVTSIYSLTNKGFRVYVKGFNLTIAKQYQFSLSYSITSLD